MTQKTKKNLLDEIFSKPPKNNYLTSKTDVYHFDNIWSLDILDRNYYGPESTRGYRSILVRIDIISVFGWRLPLMK